MIHPSTESKRQRVAQDFLDGLTSKQVAEKYGLSVTTVNRYRRESFGKKTERVKDTRIAQLEARVKTLEVMVYNLTIGRLGVVGYKIKSVKE